MQTFEATAYHTPSKEEVVFVHVEPGGGLQDLGAHLEGEEEFVLLKQPSARIPSKRKKGGEREREGRGRKRESHIVEI